MFTGIVEAVATVRAMSGGKLVCALPSVFRDIKPGMSINVAGVCLTVTKVTRASMAFDCTPETLTVTTLGSLKRGQKVNLERAMVSRARIDGHIVQGHVEGVGEVIAVNAGAQRTESRRRRNGYRKQKAGGGASGAKGASMLVIRVPKALMKGVMKRGSIAIDGVSLTIAKVEQNLCSIQVIPFTATHTTLGLLKAGDRVNIETDILVRAAFMRRSAL
jgi:riboflavin synthase